MSSYFDSIKNQHQSKRCFILGNGPSLNTHDLSRLENEYTFTVNWFALNEIYSKLKHCFYFICDPHFWNYGEGFHPELVDIIQKNKNANLFLDSSAKSLVESNHLFESYRNNNQLNYLTFSKNNKLWESAPFITDPNKTLSWGYTVIIDFCLPLAFHMGFEKVYLLGCDCDYNLDKDKDFKQSFFYDVNLIPQDDIKHLENQRDNRGSQKKTNEWFKSYKVVDSFFKEEGREIFNAGNGGKLEVFKRVSYDALF